MDALELQKMIFIYNALKTGWSVKMMAEGKFEFKKYLEKANYTKEVFLDDYLKKFIESNLEIENLNIKWVINYFPFFVIWKIKMKILFTARRPHINFRSKYICTNWCRGPFIITSISIHYSICNNRASWETFIII